MNKIEIFHRQNYLNLETFRKNGLGVRTPVWFAQEEGTFYITTFPASGKVKRIRNNGQVNIAPCTANGILKGEWVPAVAHEVLDNEIRRKAERLLDRKYGLLKKLLEFQQRRKGIKNTILEIRLVL